ncbi:MAG: DUF1059 domain-containing protein [Terriglobales bacterium]
MAEKSTHASGEREFRCAEAGHPECDWRARGKNDEEVMRQVERHGREAHGLPMNDHQKQALRHHIRAA